ncbi:MAG: DEAD/DEAH box helicase family protein [Gammaproteobacteria bacterium]|nr:DEAD/DEAH box helicase family protein [Gammaproteobacteria bacterium]
MTNAQKNLDLAGRPSARLILDRIREESRDESEKGRWFEQLFMRIALQQPEFEIDAIWRWPNWPEREALTDLDGRDMGIDLVARRISGEWVAIQCKCYEDRHRLGKGEIDKFLGGSQQPIFSLRWIVATCRWSDIAERAIRNAYPQVRQIDFRQHLDVQVEEHDFERPVQQPWPLQAEAIEDVVIGLTDQDRGRLTMACGTGKTFTALRVAERLVEDGGRILFAAPTIALVSQARREWLRQTTRRLKCLVVCSDPTAGGRNENEDIRVSELECPVTTDPTEIARSLDGDGPTRVLFCTYHSLRRVTEAQATHHAPAFDLAISDEAHRTTGTLIEGRRSSSARKVDFQEFHDNARLHAHKRLYMTATPRLYTERSKNRLVERGIGVVDMGDYDVYGPELHRLPFAKAVNEQMLSDYRVIVLGLSEGSVTPGLRRSLERINASVERKRAPTTNDMTRVLGVSLAVNGVTEGKALEQPGKLPRTLAFANSIERSKWYARALKESEVLRATTRRLWAGRAMKVVANHLDASSSALQRNQELRALANADREGECRVVCNVKLFTEGVDIPSLDAVAFLDPRDSQVDVVQAVGRVMRKAPGKRFGYIIIPVVVEPGLDVAAALQRGTEGYQTVGRVLRALQAHDGRLAESPANFIKVYEQTANRAPGGSTSGWAIRDAEQGEFQRELDLKEAEQGIYAHVAAASGLGKPGQIVADEITDTVRRASATLQLEAMEGPLAEALDLVPENDGGAKGICTVAALMLCNACLLQRRLRDEPAMKAIVRLDRVAGAKHPKEILEVAWEAILEKDYAPVFRPALAVLGALREGKAIEDAIRMVAECANRVADSLSDLGYDHAGPLYHRILGSAKSDGAFYTNNLSAIMLARLAFAPDFIDWADIDAVMKLRVIDPACGTGTLLMATLQAIKARVAESAEARDEGNALHKRLVEDVLCGLDINQHGIQLAACNMTLGAPTVDYARMNLVTMPHGPQSSGSPKAGALEILTAANDARDLHAITAPRRSLQGLDATQVDESEVVRFPLRDLDVVIMNAPFTANENRSRKYGDAGRKAMQLHELRIQQYLEHMDSAIRGVVTANSIGTFFTPLADALLNDKRGTLAKVIPTTACTNTSGLAERRFLAERFHIETVVTSHDPRRPNFSENTSIHESLLICRRRDGDTGGVDQPTRFVALRTMPTTPDEAIEAIEAIETGTTGKWIAVHEHPEELVRQGDWRPCQFLDPELVHAAFQIEQGQVLVPLRDRYILGPAGRRIRDTFEPVNDSGEGYRVFWRRSKELHTTMEANPEQLVAEKKDTLAARYRQQAGNVLLAARFDTISGRLLAVFSESPALGSMWVPIQRQTTSLDEAKALCAWFNSTLGALGFLMGRETKLTNPSFSQAELAVIPVPDFKATSSASLAKAYEETKQMPVKAWKHAANDDVRDCLDQAASETTGIELTTIRDW